MNPNLKLWLKWVCVNPSAKMSRCFFINVRFVKANNIDIKIGYPDFIKEDFILNGLYDDVSIKNITYYIRVFLNEINNILNTF